jgi:hypothetical protein
MESVDSIFGFEPQLAVAMVAVSLGYYFCVLSPLIFASVVAWKKRASLQRKVLFVSSVLAVSYSLLLVFLLAIFIPIWAFMVFVAPTMRFAGYLTNAWFIAFAQFADSAQHWWFLILPAVLAIIALLVTRYLAKRWNGIVNAL